MNNILACNLESLDITKYNQYEVIGITGIIGSGKSFLSKRLEINNNANIIEIDEIRRNLLWYSLSLLAIDLRKEIIKQFNIGVFDNNYFFNRKKFTEYIFSDIENLKKFNQLCIPYFKEEIKNKIIENKLNCIVWVNLIEERYLELLEYLIILNITEEKWHNNNKKDIDLLLKRREKQNSFKSKITMLKCNNIKFEVINNG